MNPNTNYYELLEVSPYADLAELTVAYMRISKALAVEGGELAPAEKDFRLQLVKHAYEVLSSPSRRSEYDAGLAASGAGLAWQSPALHAEAALEDKKWSPIRRLLTVIAGLMAIGMAIQLVWVLTAYQRTSAAVGGSEVGSSAAEKVYLQDLYQTHGIRAANRAEAELLLADIQRKEQAEREQRTKEQQAQEQERKQRRFEEEARREGAMVTANVMQAEQEAERAKEEALRQKEERERADKAAERARLDNEINRFRSRSSGQY
jgi:curved DNA-binding protein CbpA